MPTFTGNLIEEMLAEQGLASPFKKTQQEIIAPPPRKTTPAEAVQQFQQSQQEIVTPSFISELPASLEQLAAERNTFAEELKIREGQQTGVIPDIQVERFALAAALPTDTKRRKDLTAEELKRGQEILSNLNLTPEEREDLNLNKEQAFKRIFRARQGLAIADSEQRARFFEIFKPTVLRGLTPQSEAAKQFDLNRFFLGQEEIPIDLADQAKLFEIEYADNQLPTIVPNYNRMPEQVRFVLRDLFFNVGLTKLKTFPRFLKAINSNDFDQAANELLFGKGSPQKDDVQGTSGLFRGVHSRALENAELLRSLAPRAPIGVEQFKKTPDVLILDRIANLIIPDAGASSLSDQLIQEQVTQMQPPLGAEQLQPDFAPPSRPLGVEELQHIQKEDAFQASLSGIRDTITAKLANQLGLPVDELLAKIGKDPSYEPISSRDRAIQFGTSLIDPALGPLAKVGARAVGPVSKLVAKRAFGRTAANLTGKVGITAVEPAAQRAARTASAIVTGTGEAASIGAGLSVAEQLEQTGTIDPVRTIAETTLSAGTGAVFGKIFDKLRVNKENILAKQKQNFNKAFGPETSLPDLRIEFKPQTAEQQKRRVVRNVKAIDSLDRRITRIQASFAKARTPETRSQRLDRLINLRGKRAEQAQALQNSIGGAQFEALMRAKTVLGSKHLSKAITARGVVIKADDAAYILNSVKEIPRIQSSSFATTDIFRIVAAAEGSPRGPLRRILIDPLDDAMTRLVGHQQKLFDEFQRITAPLQLRPRGGILPQREISQRIVNAIETRTVEELPTAARKVAQKMQQDYALLLKQLNNVRKLNNLAPIKKRKDYFPHMEELKLADELGLSLSSSKLPVDILQSRTPRFPFAKPRKGFQRDTDIVRVYSGYVNAALRHVHLAGPGTQVKAYSEFLPPNLKRAVDGWLSRTVFGGLDPVDALPGADILAKGFGVLRNLAVGRFILGSARVALQQPSQIIQTANITGVGETLKALRVAVQPLPRSLIRKSNFLQTRNVMQEFQPVPSAVLGSSDKFLRWFTSSTDMIVAKQTWAAAFSQAKKLNLTDDAAVRYADDVGRWVHARYEPIWRAPLISGRLKGSVLPFQTFGFNLYNFLKQDTKGLAQLRNTSRRTEVLRALTSIAATDMIYESVGIPGPFGLIKMLPINITQIAQGDDPRLALPESLIPRVGPFALASGSPIIQIGTDLGKGIRETIKFIHSAPDDPEAFRKWAKAVGGLGANFIKGGQQIFNTIEGIDAVNRGYANVGREQVDLVDPRDTIIAPLTGSSGAISVRAAREEARILED